MWYECWVVMLKASRNTRAALVECIKSAHFSRLPSKEDGCYSFVRGQRSHIGKCLGILGLCDSKSWFSAAFVYDNIIISKLPNNSLCSPNKTSKAVTNLDNLPVGIQWKVTVY